MKHLLPEIGLVVIVALFAYAIWCLWSAWRLWRRERNEPGSGRWRQRRKGWSPFHNE